MEHSGKMGHITTVRDVLGIILRPFPLTPFPIDTLDIESLECNFTLSENYYIERTTPNSCNVVGEAMGHLLPDLDRLPYNADSPLGSLIADTGVRIHILHKLHLHIRSMHSTASLGYFDYLKKANEYLAQKSQENQYDSETFAPYSDISSKPPGFFLD